MSVAECTRRVLFIDDDIAQLGHWVEEFDRDRYEVQPVSNVDDALEIARQSPPPDGVILDIMMPPGAAYEAEDTQLGMRTGVFLYRDMIALFPHLPVLVLTNLTLAEIRGQFELRPRLGMLQKEDCESPTRIVVALQRLVDIPVWCDILAERMRGFSAFKDGWDSYGALRIDEDIVEGAIEFAVQIAAWGAPEPQAVPTPGGGIQLEWHQNGVDLEIEFLAPTLIAVEFWSATRDISEEGDVNRLRKKCKQLVREFKAGGSDAQA